MGSSVIAEQTRILFSFGEKNSNLYVLYSEFMGVACVLCLLHGNCCLQSVVLATSLLSRFPFLVFTPFLLGHRHLETTDSHCRVTCRPRREKCATGSGVRPRSFSCKPGPGQQLEAANISPLLPSFRLVGVRVSLH